MSELQPFSWVKSWWNLKSKKFANLKFLRFRLFFFSCEVYLHFWKHTQSFKVKHQSIALKFLLQCLGFLSKLSGKLIVLNVWMFLYSSPKLKYHFSDQIYPGRRFEIFSTHFCQYFPEKKLYGSVCVIRRTAFIFEYLTVFLKIFVDWNI